MSTSTTVGSIEEITLSNMLVVEALVEQLGQKGLINRKRLTERVGELRHQRRLALALTPTEQAIVDNATKVLVASNFFVLDLFMDLLFDKGYLDRDETEELKSKLAERVKIMRRTQ